MDKKAIERHFCTCGHRVAKGDEMIGGGLRKNGGMDASFVHLALPANVAPPPLWSETTSHHASHEGFLETVRHASALLRAGQGNFDEGDLLCRDCVDRYDSASMFRVFT
jgi:hypothetical protein